MKKTYVKPQIVAVTVVAEEFFAAAGNYDPEEVARALSDSGILPPGVTIDPWELES